VYVVQPGDCLWNIAKHELGNPLLWPSIAKLNHLKRPNHILIGEKLLLPDAPGKGVQSAPSPSDAGRLNKATITPSVFAAPTPSSGPAANKNTQVAPNSALDDHSLAQHPAFPISVVYDAEFPLKTIEYDLDTPAAEIHVKINYKLKFKLLAQDAGGSPSVSINQDGKVEFKQTVNSQLSQLASNAKFGIDLSELPPKKLEFMSGLSFLNNGKPIVSVYSGVIYKSDNGWGLKYTLESGQIEHVYQGIKYAGKVAIDAEVFLTIHPKIPPQHPVPVGAPAYRPAPYRAPEGYLAQAEHAWNGLSTGQKVAAGVGVVAVAVVVVVAWPEIAAAGAALESGEAVAGALAWARGFLMVARPAFALAPGS
jgi:hypothetical protein